MSAEARYEVIRTATELKRRMKGTYPMVPVMGTMRQPGDNPLYVQVSQDTVLWLFRESVGDGCVNNAAVVSEGVNNRFYRAPLYIAFRNVPEEVAA